jgi:pSer/pThr/pTyr-binding forkhead associated (FHA) protein
MTTCPQCGTQNLPGMAYCEHCGSPLSAPEQEEAPAAATADPSVDETIARAKAVLEQMGGADADPTTTAPDEDHDHDHDAPIPHAEDDAATDGGLAPVAAPAATSAAQTLTITFPGDADYVVHTDVTNIGRSDVAQNWHPELDLIPFGGGAPDLGVSRHQAVIQRNGGGFLLIDVGSTNGTFVNGKAMEYNKPIELHDGDSIAFGAFNAKVSIR